MQDIIKEINQQYHEIEQRLADPDIFSDQAKLTRLNQEYKKLKDRQAVAQKLDSLYQELSDAKQMQLDEDIEYKQLGVAEEKRLVIEIEQLEVELKALLLPTDPLDETNAIMEIRAAAGGMEASLFANELMRMYLKFGEKSGFSLEIINITDTDQGLKEASIAINGQGAYGVFKYESGVHRVQRVPKTETQGRIHTSTVSVVVRPEITQEEISINDSDLKIETMRSGGPGGQHANKVESAVRITHIPTGVQASSQMKSQKQNREEAMRVLRSRLYEMQLEKADDELSQMRRQLIGSADRAEKNRTYNFAENRVTDHRVPVTLYKLDKVLEGDLSELIETMRQKDREDALITMN